MAIEREIEFKQLLDADSYVSIKTQHFKGQTLLNKSITISIRLIFKYNLKKWHCVFIEKADGTFELTLKVPDTVGLLEYNAQFHMQPAENMTLKPSDIDDDIREVLEQRHVQLDALKILGALTTYRLETQTDEGLLVLDHSLYLGTEDYELEFEVRDFEAGQQAFNNLLAQLKLSPVVPKNKVQRFFEYQRKLQ